MMPNRFSGMLKPDYVIPFTKTKDDAVAALKEFYKGKRLLPAAFTANNRIQDIQPCTCLLALRFQNPCQCRLPGGRRQCNGNQR